MSDGRLLVLLGLAGLAGTRAVVGSRGVVRMARASQVPQDPSLREQILESAARALFVMAWANAWENSGRSTRGWGGQDLMQLAPPTNERAKTIIATWAGKIERQHGAPLDVLYERAAAETELEIEQNGARHQRPIPDRFGHYLAMEAMGHGTTWMDDHADHGLGRLPHLEDSDVDPDLGSSASRGSRGVVRRARGVETRLGPLLEQVIAREPPLVAASTVAFFASYELRHRKFASDPIEGARIPKIPQYAGPLGLMQLREEVGSLAPSANLGARTPASPETAVQAFIPFLRRGTWWSDERIEEEEPAPGVTAWLARAITAICEDRAPAKMVDPLTHSNQKIVLDDARLTEIRARQPRWYSIRSGEAAEVVLGTADELGAHVRLAELWQHWTAIVGYAQRNPDTWMALDGKQAIRVVRKRS